MLKAVERGLERIWKVLISLKLAVLVIASLAITLSIATILESQYDSKTAQYYVYRATWFYALLTLLGLNILAVALSRLPWKKKHTPFLMAHAGILMILTGSWLTYVNGVDGSLRISEGEVNSAVELDQHVLVFKRGEDVKTAPLDWMPEPAAEKFKGLEFSDFRLKVDQFLPDAEPKVQFVPPKDPTQKAAPAIQIRIIGAPMGGAPEFWLWAGDPGWATQKLGPARFLIRTEQQKDLRFDPSSGPEARFDFVVGNDGSLRYETLSIRGEKQKGMIALQAILNKEEPLVINPGWKMPIRVQVKSFVPSGMNLTEYVPVKVKPVGMGSSIPQPAIRISLLSNPASKMWLGLGDRADFTDVDGTLVSIGYYPRRVILPYALRLQRFEMTHNPGTMDPASYSSYIQVVDQMQKTEKELNQLPVHHITMNEPLDSNGYTFYQASYIPEMPRPTTTILSVNRDPGRGLKYWGSILLILGSISLYLSKVLQRKKSKGSLSA
jgi:hypothetical protein